jgi:4-hydroxy-tetrahydrodipicolinate synthase
VIKADGLYIHGFYGNFWLLTTTERKRAIEIVVDEARGAVPIFCRCAHQSLKETIDLIKHAEGAGVDFISLIGPWLARGSEDMIYRYFELVAAETDLGISIFNTPQAGYTTSPALMARLAGIPNVCALKNGMPMAHTIQVRHLVGDSIVVLDPEEETFLINLTQFGQQAIYTGTNMMVDSARATPMRDYVKAAIRGEHRLAAELYYQMQPIRDVHRKWVLEPWFRDGLCPISTIKWWTQQLGLTGGPTRPPLPEIGPAEREALLRDLAAVGLIAPKAPVTTGS